MRRRGGWWPIVPRRHAVLTNHLAKVDRGDLDGSRRLPGSRERTFTLSPKSPYQGRGSDGSNPGANIESLALARFMSVAHVPNRGRP